MKKKERTNFKRKDLNFAWFLSFCDRSIKFNVYFFCKKRCKIYLTFKLFKHLTDFCRKKWIQEKLIFSPFKRLNIRWLFWSLVKSLLRLIYRVSSCVWCILATVGFCNQSSNDVDLKYVIRLSNEMHSTLNCNIVINKNWFPI